MFNLEEDRSHEHRSESRIAEQDLLTVLLSALLIARAVSSTKANSKLQLGTQRYASASDAESCYYV